MYRYVSRAHICTLGSQRVKLSDQIGRLISKISKLFTAKMKCVIHGKTSL